MRFTNFENISVSGFRAHPCVSPLQLCTAQKVKCSIEGFFSKCDQIRKFPADMVTFTEEILNGKFHFLCSGGMLLLPYVESNCWDAQTSFATMLIYMQ